MDGYLLIEKPENASYQCLCNWENIDTQLHSAEEKFINNQISADAYSCWHTDLTCKRLEAKDTIEKLSRAGQQTRMLLKTELQKLNDMNYVWQSAGILQKQELLRMLFDSRLYYQNHTYRTPYIMPAFTHDLLILKEKRLLIVDANEAKTGENPVRLSSQDFTRTLEELLLFLRSIKAA